VLGRLRQLAEREAAAYLEKENLFLFIFQIIVHNHEF
jgi:hypothetical protein